jgi:hypothetical protein
MNNVTLQINLSPLDFPRVLHLLPHQLRTLANQCSELLIIVDLKKSKCKKSSGESWDRNIQPVMDFLYQLKAKHFPGLRIEMVDYSEHTRKLMSKTIMKHGIIPDKDYSGGPFYSYYFGIYTAKNDYVLHTDADMMFGGGYQNWVTEAIEILERDATIFSCSPIAGPPLLSQDQLPSFYRKKFNPTGKYYFLRSYLYNHFSTRTFLINKKSIYKKISVQLPNFDHFIKALLRGASPYRYPEGTISEMIKRQKLYRLDFYGYNPGLWCLHPNGDSKLNEFLPEVLSLIESNQFPDSQRGLCDVHNNLLIMAEQLHQQGMKKSG